MYVKGPLRVKASCWGRVAFSATALPQSHRVSKARQAHRPGLEV
ncbi:MAG: hypothetical protein ACI81R_003063, partial [Bradymonadia bacterium]